MSTTEYIKVGGGVYAINPAGHVVVTKLIPLKGGVVGLKPNWRAATAADLDSAKKAENENAKKATADRKAISAGGPVAQKGA